MNTQEHRETSMQEDHDAAPWFILAIVLFAGVAATANYYKVPPLMPLLLKTFGVSRGMAGLLMSVFAVAGVALAIPGGLVLNRFGGRATGMAALAFIASGSIVGASSGYFWGMACGRLIEGVGMTLLAIVAPIIIAHQFGQRKRPIALGIFAVWYPLGSTITLLSTPALASSHGWQSVWWSSAAYAVVAAIVLFIFLKAGDGHDGAKAVTTLPAALRRQDSPLKKSVSNPDVWLIALVFCCFSLQYGAFFTWTPTFLFHARGISLSRSAMLMSFVSMLGIASGPLTGWLFQRIVHRRLFCAIGIALFSLLIPLILYSGARSLALVMAVIGLVSSVIPVAVSTMVADLLSQKKTSAIGQSVVNIGQSTGILLGPTVFGSIVDVTGSWSSAYWLLVPVGLLGGACAIILRMRLIGQVRAGLTADPALQFRRINAAAA
jgi:cyanate permease